MFGLVIGVSFLVMIFAALAGLVRFTFRYPTTTKNFSDKLDNYRESKSDFRRSYVTSNEFWLSGANIVNFIQRFTDDKIKVSVFSAHLFFDSLCDTAIKLRENNDYIKPEYTAEINSILSVVNEITDNPDSRLLLCSNDREIRKIFWKLFLKVSTVHKNIRKDSEKREKQKAFAGRSAALEIVSRLDEECYDKNPEIIFGQSGTGKTISLHSDSNGSPVSADTVTFDTQNHDDGDEEEDLDNEDVWSLSNNTEG